MMKKLLLLSFIFLFTPLSWASIAFEPYLGTGIGRFNSWRYGYSMGARVGYSRWGLEMGLDASYSSFSFFNLDIEYTGPECESANATGVSQIIPCEINSEDDYGQSGVGIYHNIFLGPSVSFGLPLIVDAYVSLGWIWSSTSYTQDVFSLKGPSAKVGVSYLNLPFLRINLELQAILLQCSNGDNKIQESCQGKTTLSYNKPIFIGQIYLSIPIDTVIF